MDRKGRKTMIARKKCYADGGSVEPEWKRMERESMARIARQKAGVSDYETPTYLGSVKERIKELGTAAKEAVTPRVVKTIQERERRIATGEDGYKRGGQVKTKARGDGCAQRGKTKGRHV